jgi:hypothetical protein
MLKHQDLLPLVPQYHHWVSEMLKQHEDQMKPIDTQRFPRLKNFFQAKTLESARCVVVDQLPFFPWEQFGLPEPEGMELEDNSFIGITYRNTYFVLASANHDESLHCHELVHVVQWQQLGNDLYPLLYGLDVFEKGYEECFLEKIARGFEQVFQNQTNNTLCESYVMLYLGACLPGFLTRLIKGQL